MGYLNQVHHQFWLPYTEGHNTPFLHTKTETTPKIVLKQCWGKLVPIFRKQVGKIVAIDAACINRAVAEERPV